jgi:hypothetical protein
MLLSVLLQATAAAAGISKLLAQVWVLVKLVVQLWRLLPVSRKHRETFV